ncbi:Sulfotransferase family-containing protein [Strongyloides ratti]|uniref:Sulfotransferase family-containing protein n=1 Tax=Strongyloides ratti TaxID=34506 RepID=A0A090LK68_STRRB|nr:Sulfotransferase family-containing protein [Strongyloides ratti]CEF70108.1 Sulfotransferase family-containing protein [Strongyloides ratti]
MLHIYLFFFSLLYLTFVKGYDNSTLNITQISITKFLKPEHFTLGYHVIAPKYNLTSCYIGKSLSSMTIGLFCYLYDEKKFLANYKTVINGGANRRICNSKNSYSSISNISKEYTNGNKTEILKNWKHLMIIREPVSRFISGFVQLCVLNIGLEINHPYCFNCKKNLKCFLKKLYYHIINLGSNLTKIDKFIMYHFYPQSWQCEYLKYKDNYKIILYTSNAKEFYKEYLLKLEEESLIPKDKIKFIKQLIYNSKIIHSTSDKKITKYYENKLLKNEYLISLIKTIYINDYEEFNFKI